ncbi:hypothetical protein [Haliscomenobacter sp.]|uniref:hypothetical protein n=1 Tax=Haliscomenobacter sp. TaxID=2717303 RepID=UPI003BAC3075
MSNQNNSDSEKAAIAVILWVVAIIYFKTFLILLKVTLLLGVVALVFYVIYQLNRKTGFINALFDRFADKVSNKVKIIPKEQAFLEEADTSFPDLNVPASETLNFEVIERMDKMESILTNVTLENERLREEKEQAEQNAILRVEKENKSAILNDIFGTPERSVPVNSQYSASDDYEKQQFQDNLRKREEELQFREFQQTANEKFFQQDMKIHENKQEIHGLRQDMDGKFLLIQRDLLDLKNDVITIRVYVDHKFNEMEISFHNDIALVKECLVNFKAEVSQKFSDITLRFGQEILRLDQAQLKIIDRVGMLQQAVKMNGIEMIQLRNLFDRGQIRAEEMLSRASILHEKSQLSMQAISKEVQLNLQQMAIHKQGFANEVGSATLKLERISQDQYLALKDVAYEKMGVNMLRQEFDQRVALEQGKLNNMLADKRRVEERIQERISRNQQVSDLTHQLHMAEEKIGHASQRMNLMQQEASIIRRQSNQ